MRLQHVVILTTAALFITDTSASRNLKSPSPPPVNFNDIDGEERAPTFKGIFGRGSSSKKAAESFSADMAKLREEVAKLDANPEEEKQVVFQAYDDYFTTKGAYHYPGNILNDPGLYDLMIKLNRRYSGKRPRVWHFLHAKYKNNPEVLQQIISGADQDYSNARLVAEELAKLG